MKRRIIALILLVASSAYCQCVESSNRKQIKVAAAHPKVSVIESLVPLYESDDVSILIDTTQSKAGAEIITQFPGVSFSDSSARKRKLPISNAEPEEWAFAKTLGSCVENGCLVIYDKQKKRYVKSLTKTLFDYRECPAGSGGGREFSYNKIVILYLIDWLSS